MKQALADALKRRGYETLTSVQQAVTDPKLAHEDLLVSAQTGSGKTVGFGLAIAPTLLGDAEAFDHPDNPLGLVIAPTRELALQVKRELIWLYQDTNATVASCVGGMDMRDERRALSRGAHIVVATPGRLVDHIKRNNIDLSDTRAVVLDEADEMLDLGFREDLEFILSEAPEERQTLLFSATVPPQIAKLAKSFQRDSIRVSTTEERKQHSDIDYQAMMVAHHDRENAVINVLRYYEASNAIVFANTREMVNRLKTRLSNRGFAAVALSGELSQNDRTQALQAMRDGKARVCVATDVAARGIDLPNLSLVVHAELPSNHETLLHRSGRTGRAGRKGTCALIVSQKSRRKAERLLREAKVKATWDEAPSAEAIKQRDNERMLEDPFWLEPIDEGQQVAITKLIDALSPEQIAAGFLRLYQEKYTAPEELSDANAKPEPREAFGPSTWFSIGLGRKHDADPRRLLPMICKAGDLTKKDIGAIRIQTYETFVEISQGSVERFLRALGPDMHIIDKASELGIDVRQLNEPPVVAQGRPRSSKSGDGRSRSKERFENRYKKRDSYKDDKPQREPRRDFKQERSQPKRDKNEGFDPLQQAYQPKADTENAGRKPKKPHRGKAPKDGAKVTPVGKPNSKKNKARRAAAEAAAKKGKTDAS